MASYVFPTPTRCPDRLLCRILEELDQLSQRVGYKDEKLCSYSCIVFESNTYLLAFDLCDIDMPASTSQETTQRPPRNSFFHFKIALTIALRKQNCTVPKQRVYNSAASILWNALPDYQKAPFIKRFQNEKALFKERGGSRKEKKSRSTLGFYDNRPIPLTFPYEVAGQGNCNSAFHPVLHADHLPNPQQLARKRSRIAKRGSMTRRQQKAQVAFAIEVQCAFSLQCIHG